MNHQNIHTLARHRAGRIRRRICGGIAVVLFFLLLGTVGAIEHNGLGLGAGAARVAVLTAAFALFAWLGGAGKERRSWHH